MLVDEIRLIIDKHQDPHYNMGFDEALLTLRARREIPPTLRLYMWDPSAVTIGYFQRIRDVVNLDYALEKKIPVIRRITGGGAVYHDRDGEVTYSIVLDARGKFTDVQESYRIICSGIVEALRDLGLEAVFKPVNDILLNGRKVSGSAQTRRKNTLLQHGTLMVSTNLDELARLLVVPREKLESHRARSIRERVTTISIELGRTLSPEDMIPQLIEGFRKALGARLIEEKPSPSEERLAEKYAEKYRSVEWNYKR